MSNSNNDRSSDLLQFMLLLGKLKSTPRTGWVLCGVKKPESIADHMYRMAVMAFLAGSDSDLDREKCMKLALVHDMAESIVGDITPHDGVSDEDKHQQEAFFSTFISMEHNVNVNVPDGVSDEYKHKQEGAAMQHITNLVGSEVGQELYDLWQEYETQLTNEAKFVKDLDRFDMILQAFEYEVADDRPQQLQEFFTCCEGKFKSDKVQQWVSCLSKLRSSSSASSACTTTNSVLTERQVNVLDESSP